MGCIQDDMIKRRIEVEIFNQKIFGGLKIFIDNEPKSYICVINNINDIDELTSKTIYLGSNE